MSITAPMVQAYGQPPMPADIEERLRWQHTALRWRLLYGRHEEDVWARLVAKVGPQRARAWRPIDLSSNPFLLAYTQLAALYQDEPGIIGPHPDVSEAVAESGFWCLAQRNQRDTLGLRELPVLCDLDEVGAPRAVVIWPHRCRIVVNPRRPSVPVAVHWWEPDPRDPAAWVEYHIDPRSPAYWVTDEKGADISKDLLGGAKTGEAYPWRALGGAPVQPVVLYHAAETGAVWDPYAGIEVVEGSMHLSIQYTNFNHIIHNAAWSQRYTIGLTARGGDQGEGGTQQVVADPAVVMQFDPDEDAAQAQAGQWALTADPERVIASIRQYERRLIEQAVGGVEVTRESSDIRSGYSLAVSREAQILAQERYAPVFRRPDREALRVWSALLGAARGVDYPTIWPTRTGGVRLTRSGSPRPEADIEYAIPGGVPSAPAT